MKKLSVVLLVVSGVLFLTSAVIDFRADHPFVSVFDCMMAAFALGSAYTWGR